MRRHIKDNWRSRYSSIVFLILILFYAAGSMEAADQVTECPHYENGDYWIFNAQEFSTDTRSNILNGSGYKVLYQDGQFKIENFPYQNSLLRFFFPCGDGGPAEQVKLPLYLGSKWKIDHVRSVRNKQFRFKFAAEVVASERFETEGEIFQAFGIHRVGTYDDPSMDSDDYYFYVPEMKSVVLFYRFARKSFFSSRIYLTAIGSKDAKSVKGFNASKLFDPLKDKQFFELYSTKR